jgi:hypothetical protein
MEGLTKMNRPAKRIIATLLFSVCALVAAAARADLVIGLPADPNNGNQYPFGGNYNAEYQQVYTSSQFPGAITITDLEFYNTQVDFGATSLNSGTWTISLSTTSVDWNTIGTTFASNLGPDNTVVFSGVLGQPWAFGDTLTIILTTPFTYNPANGNLLMDVVATSLGFANVAIFFDTNGYIGGGYNGNTIIGRDFCPGGSGCTISGSVDHGYGLVTGFSTGAAPAPEPATLLLLGTGLLVGIGRTIKNKVRS